MVVESSTTEGVPDFARGAREDWLDMGHRRGFRQSRLAARGSPIAEVIPPSIETSCPDIKTMPNR